MRSRMRARGLATAGLAAMLLIGPALAAHAGPSGDVVGNGHYWPFKKTPVTITFGDNLDSKWEGYFDDSLRRWNKSDVIKGKSTPPWRRCAAPARCGWRRAGRTAWYEVHQG